MQNTGQYKFTAKKIIAKLSARLEKDPNALYADWIIALMREGFTKKDAVEAFRKSDFVLMEDGGIIPRSELRSIKHRRRTEAGENPRSLEASQRALELEHAQKRIHMLELELMEAKNRQLRAEHHRLARELSLTQLRGGRK